MFRDWLEECVDWFGQPVPRWKCLRMFVEEGLIPFLSRHGYTFSYSEKELANYLATGFYENRTRSHLNSFWRCGTAPDGSTEEDEAHFYHVVSRNDWDQFWTQWGHWADVCPDVSSRATDRRMDCETFVWACINLNSSPQTQTLAEIIAGGEDEEEVAATPSRPGRQGVDTYILESVDYNGWGGYRK